VPCPDRVESTKTFPPRSSFRYAVVATAGSSRSTRAASARFAAAASSMETPRSGTTTCSPFAPLVFTAPARPASSSDRRTRCATAATAAKSAPSGGSRSSTSPVGSWASTVKNGTWNSTDRWLASHSSVRRSSQSTWCTSRCAASDHTVTVRTQSGAPFITFFCMNGAAPGRTRLIVSGRPASCGTSRSAKASR
jgi:hypothetical protein